MDSVLFRGLEADLPADVVELAQKAYEVKNYSESLAQKIQAPLYWSTATNEAKRLENKYLQEPELFNAYNQTKRGFHALGSIYIGFLRKNAQEEIGQHLPSPTQKDAAAPVPKVFEWYLEELRKDFNNRQTIIKRIEDKNPDITPYTFQAIAEFEVFSDILFNAITRTKRDWYARVNLEPYPSRSKKIRVIKQELTWRLRELNQASTEILSYMQNQPIEKDIQFIKNSAFKIAEIYEKRIYRLADSPEVAKLHKSKDFTALNTLLALVYQSAKNQSVFGRYSTEHLRADENSRHEARLFEIALTQSVITDFNDAMRAAIQNKIRLLVSYADKDFLNNYAARTFKPSEVKDLLARPTPSDHKNYSRLLVYNLFAETGSINQPIEKEKGIVTVT